MIRLALLCLCLLAPAVAAEPKYGILRNYSGLPLVFPLAIKSDPGRDLLIALREPDSWDVAYTARVEGGAFFRVLVPVGTYVLEITPEGGAPYLYPQPLTFRIEGLNRKVGHSIDLRGGDLGAPEPIAFCQSRRIDPDDWRDLRDYWRLPPGDPERPDRVPGPQLRERLCDGPVARRSFDPIDG